MDGFLVPPYSILFKVPSGTPDFSASSLLPILLSLIIDLIALLAAMAGLLSIGPLYHIRDLFQAKVPALVKKVPARVKKVIDKFRKRCYAVSMDSVQGHI
jgi:hypothetical protein